MIDPKREREREELKGKANGKKKKKKKLKNSVAKRYLGTRFVVKF
jgi:hypothetical protein